MKKQKLNYRFHNPNPTDKTIDHILKVFIDVNMKKIDRAIQKEADPPASTRDQTEQP